MLISCVPGRRTGRADPARAHHARHGRSDDGAVEVDARLPHRCGGLGGLRQRLLLGRTQGGGAAPLSLQRGAGLGDLGDRLVGGRAGGLQPLLGGEASGRQALVTFQVGLSPAGFGLGVGDAAARSAIMACSSAPRSSTLRAAARSAATPASRSAIRASSSAGRAAPAPGRPDPLVVGDQHLGDVALHLGADGHGVGLDVGVIGGLVGLLALPPRPSPPAPTAASTTAPTTQRNELARHGGISTLDDGVQHTTAAVAIKGRESLPLDPRAKGRHLRAESRIEERTCASASRRRSNRTNTGSA
jgi:hypothetical protein